MTTEWFEIHWEFRWEEDSGDRWDRENLAAGWDADDVEAELDEYFEENDPAMIAEDPIEQEKFELELKNAMSLYELGIQSGKVEDPIFDRIDRFDNFYETVNAKATEEGVQLKRKEAEPEKEDENVFGLTDGSIVFLGVLITLLVLITIVITIGLIMRKVKPTGADEESES